MEEIEGVKSNEWFHLIDHMYAKWPKINFPFITNMDDTKDSSHLIPDVRGSTQRRQDMKRKRGRKRKSIQKPTKKRSAPTSKALQKTDERKEDGVIRAPRVAPVPVPKRISIIQTRAQKGSGSVRAGQNIRHCSCCEGSPRVNKPSIPKPGKIEEDKKE
ncbi:hypothetical protein J437_LFUL006161 [Ladona fulva]|uniref:Uncharacterized protein n=1 Tax=Ladona fulva TaxID=123851 RepID=A0A8K0JYS9_LADFU|nr:hypothetical protein J437_LFUL006161 [Ladona fulva]